MDKPSKYFFELEKINTESLTNKRGENKTDKNEVLKLIENFYSDLYKKEKTSVYEQNTIINQIEANDIHTSENIGNFEIREREIKQALNQVSNNKSPSSGGLTKEFYIHFWQDLKEELMELYINIYLSKKLPESQKLAIIRLLYKKGDPKLLKNWRPISLLNIDYKILSKILAHRLRNEMPKIIGQDQYCGIPNRSIHNAHDILHNIWEIELKRKHNKLMYLLIDQQKAFDRLDHSYLFKILRANNLPAKFVNWVELMYKKKNKNMGGKGHTTY